MQFYLDAHFARIYDFVRDKPLAALEAPTVSGKTVGLPQHLQSRGHKVCVACRTDFAARALQLQADARKSSVQYVPTLAVWHALLEGRLQYDYYVIDDYDPVHLHHELVLALWRERQPEGKHLLLVTSIARAARDADVPELAIKEERFTLNTMYHKRTYIPQHPAVVHELAKLLLQFHRSAMEGDFLVVLPKTFEVLRLRDELLERKAPKLSVLAWSHKSDPAELAELHSPKAAGERRVYVVTNSVESLVSTRALGLVFDSMYEKRPECNVMGGVREVTCHVPKTVAGRRCARLGKRTAGTCYRMYTQESYNRLHDAHRPEWQRLPLRRYVEDLLLAGLDWRDVLPPHMHERAADAAEQIEAFGLLTPLARAPARAAGARGGRGAGGVAREIAKELSKVAPAAAAASAAPALARELTPLGRFARQYPLGLRNAALLHRWLQEGKHPSFPCIVAVGLIDSFHSNLFRYPPRRPEQRAAEHGLEVQERRHSFSTKFAGYSDVETLLNVWAELMRELGGPEEPEGKGAARAIIAWAEKTKLDIIKLIEFRAIVNLVAQVTRDLGHPVQVGKFKTAALLEALRPHVAEVYADRVLHKCPGGGSYPAYCDSRERVHRIDTRQSVNHLSADPPETLAALISFKIKNQLQDNYVVVLALDL